jgi:hypothetical protein
MPSLCKRAYAAQAKALGLLWNCSDFMPAELPKKLTSLP